MSVGKPQAPESKRTNAIFAIAFVVAIGGLAIYQYTHGQPPTDGEDPHRPARRMKMRVVETRPHDTSAFTQGLELHENRLFETTGLRGKSEVRELDPRTGEVRRLARLPERYFGEGSTIVGNELYQITWQDGVAFVYDLNTFEKKREYRYGGEGWGLCYDGRRLVMSDGSAFLTLRNPQTFESIGDLQVTVEGEPQDGLNELECVGNKIYANIWTSKQIVEIDGATGEATALITADGLISQAELEQAGADVLNGIAYDSQSRHFLITGKLWPKLFVVDFVPLH